MFLPGKFHGQRSLAGYHPWSFKEWDMTEWLSIAHTSPKRQPIQMRLPGAWSSRSGRRTEIEPGGLPVSPKLDCVFQGALQAFLLPPRIPYPFFFLALNMASVLDIDYICWWPVSGKYSLWLPALYESSSPLNALASSLKSPPSGEGSAIRGRGTSQRTHGGHSRKSHQGLHDLLKEPRGKSQPCGLHTQTSENRLRLWPFEDPLVHFLGNVSS